MCVGGGEGGGGQDGKRTPRLRHLTSNSARDCVPLRCSYRQIPMGGRACEIFETMALSIFY